MKKINKYSVVLGVIALVVALCSFTNKNFILDSNKPSNLRILPKNISEEDLKNVMQGFNAALGVKCNHCHAPKDNGEKGLNFASDANPNKSIARDMMKMTKKINSKYFSKPHEGIIQNINCNTCHGGSTTPKTIVIK